MAKVDRLHRLREHPGQPAEDPGGSMAGGNPESQEDTLDSTSEALNLDRVIHERIRLGIVSALAGHEWSSFKDLKMWLQTTDGNLSVHARKLEEAGYVVCKKRFEGRMPRTEYRLTAAGRQALERYLNHMEALIQATREHGLDGKP